MAHVSHKLKTSFEGALAGGGDPATSPLYVFGPFLKLIVVSGVAGVTFGTSVWMAVATIVVVSAMYRLVMRWVTDGSGGSGLSEEEFGGWAAKVNAAITFVEYTLTFLVSMAAMVTFIADRLPVLNQQVLGLQYRTFVAIALSILTGALVNRGPRTAARAFGPATAGVLLLLWAMLIATILKTGLHLPSFNLGAFSGEYFHFTLGGYVRILAVMTGIEVFANLVAAYEGEPAQRSRLAFNSLLIIMGTTALTMVIVGPAIFTFADVANEEISVFTQTMDRLLPAPLPLVGTLTGVAVLMSASAAAAQGLQNLALGLKERGYIPPALGEQNRYQVADRPVWIQVGIVVVCFLVFGTSEETYLALYAAGVFILLSMTGWAVAKRLIREARTSFRPMSLVSIAGVLVAAILTTLATVLIFEERFFEGAWTYFLFIPALYAMFTYFRSRFGAPSAYRDYLGMLNAAQLAGFGFGQAPTEEISGANGGGPAGITWDPEPKTRSRWRQQRVEIRRILLLLDGSPFAAEAIPAGRAIAQGTGARVFLLSSVKNHNPALEAAYATTHAERAAYLAEVQADLESHSLAVESFVRPGFLAEATAELVAERGVDLVVVTPRGKSGTLHWTRGGISRKLVRMLDVPILIVQQAEPAPAFRRILVPLDGSIVSESVLPYARAFAKAFDSELLLLSVPAVPEPKNYRAPGEVLQAMRAEAETKMGRFLAAVAADLHEEGLQVRTRVTGSLPQHTIVAVAEHEAVDLTMLTSRGRGGLDLLLTGSIANQVVEQSGRSVFMLPIPARENQ